MPEDKKAQVAEEQPVADVATFDADFEKAFDEGAESNVDAQPQEKKEDAKPVEQVAKETPKAPAPEGDPTKGEKAEKPAPAGEPDQSVEPESVIEKAEKVGAELDKSEPKGEPQSVQEQLPPEYADVPQVVQTEAFQKWFDSQPKHIQNLGIKGGVDGVCAVMDRYHDHTAKVAAEASRSTSPAGAKRLLAELGDLEMQTGDGSKTKISEYLKEYGDLGEAVAVIADALAAKRTTPAPKGDDRVARLESELSEMRFWDAVQSEHSDARKIVSSEGFKAWAKDEASPNIRRLLQSSDPQHAILGLDAYKEVLVQKAKAGKGAEGKNRTIALHSETVRGKTASVKPKAEQPTDFDDGFEAGSK